MMSGLLAKLSWVIYSSQLDGVIACRLSDHRTLYTYRFGGLGPPSVCRTLF